MPVVQVSHAPNRELYEQVAQQLDLADRRPDGLILHSASQTESGEVEIVDVYESREALDRFAKERLFPAFEATGTMAAAQSQGPPTAHEPFHYVA